MRLRAGVAGAGDGSLVELQPGAKPATPATGSGPRASNVRPSTVAFLGEARSGQPSASQTTARPSSFHGSALPRMGALAQVTARCAKLQPAANTANGTIGKPNHGALPAAHSLPRQRVGAGAGRARPRARHRVAADARL